MATVNPPDTPSADESVFDAMTEQIIAVFDRIMEEVKSRRDELLSEVDKKRTKFKSENSAMIESMRELEEMKSQMMSMSIKQNVAVKKQQESLADIDSEINRLRTNMHTNTQLKYSCSLDQLINQVKLFGKIINEARNEGIYLNKLSAVHVIDGFEGRRFGSQIRLHVDPHKELLYVTCSYVFKVLVFNAIDFQFKKEFGNFSFPPCFVATSNDSVYVTTVDKSLLRYTFLNFLFARHIPWDSSVDIIVAGIACDENNLLVLESYGSIKIYDAALNLTQKIKIDLGWGFQFSFHFISIGEIAPIGMVIREEKIYFFNINKIFMSVSFGDWNNISCYFKKEKGKIPNVEDPSTFCIDSGGNVIVADPATNSIKFLSPAGGDLIHTIGEVAYCSDITVHKNSIIVACIDPITKQYNIRVY